jgi:hypothetical protein
MNKTLDFGKEQETQPAGLGSPKFDFGELPLEMRREILKSLVGDVPTLVGLCISNKKTLESCQNLPSIVLDPVTGREMQISFWQYVKSLYRNCLLLQWWLYLLFEHVGSEFESIAVLEQSVSIEEEIDIWSTTVMGRNCFLISRYDIITDKDIVQLETGELGFSPESFEELYIPLHGARIDASRRYIRAVTIEYLDVELDAYEYATGEISQSSVPPIHIIKYLRSQEFENYAIQQTREKYDIVAAYVRQKRSIVDPLCEWYWWPNFSKQEWLVKYLGQGIIKIYVQCPPAEPIPDLQLVKIL